MSTLWTGVVGGVALPEVLVCLHHAGVTGNDEVHWPCVCCTPPLEWWPSARFSPRPSPRLSGAQRLSRRDDNADRFSIYLDPRCDRLTGVRFEVSAAGLQNDEIIFSDSWMDHSWDTVWTSAVQHGDQGWSLEMRICPAPEGPERLEADHLTLQLTEIPSPLPSSTVVR